MRLVVLLVNGNWVDSRTVVMPLSNVRSVVPILNDGRSLWNIAELISTSKSEDFRGQGSTDYQLIILIKSNVYFQRFRFGE